MNKSKCPVCGSSHTVKNGKRNGVQTYVCKDCHYQFRNDKLPSDDEIWRLYQDNKQTVEELASMLGTSASTIKRRLCKVKHEWVQPSLNGSGFVHMDATYWGRGWGVLLAIDSATGRPLYLSFITSETTADYKEAVESIKNRGYSIKGLIIDGKKSLFPLFSEYKLQMCQFHMRQIIRRYLTRNPRLKAARALNDLVSTLAFTDGNDFKVKYRQWKDTWKQTLQRRSVLRSGKTCYTHRRLRSAIHSLDFYLPYLFTCQEAGCEGMPHTNNKIEGTFTDLKKNLNAHSGMSETNRKRFISGFFLALDETLSMKKQKPPME